MLYTNSRRQEVVSKNPGVKVTDVSTIIGKEWKELTDEEKDVGWQLYCLDLEGESKGSKVDV